MEIQDLLYLLVCGIGTVNSVFFSLYLFISKKGSRLLNSFLALIILSFSLRVSKYLWLNIFENSHPLLHNIWSPAFYVLGFLIFIYFSLLSGKEIKNLTKPILIIFAGTIAASGVSYIINPSFDHHEFLNVILLTLILGLAFSIPSIKQIFPKRDKNNLVLKNWILSLLAFLIIIMLMYLLINFIRFNVLLIESYLFSAAIYAIIFAEIKYGILIKIHKNPSKENSDDEEIINQLNDLMESEKMYLDPNLTLQIVASRISISTHNLSRTINSFTGQNYNDFVNQFRIKEASKILSDPENNKKISSIAYECGFNSVSVFNSAFKKFTGITPTKYLENNPPE